MMRISRISATPAEFVSHRDEENAKKISAASYAFLSLASFNLSS
jgi:hypothetical protein